MHLQLCQGAHVQEFTGLGFGPYERNHNIARHNNNPINPGLFLRLPRDQMGMKTSGNQRLRLVQVNNEEFKAKKILIASGGVCNKQNYSAKDKVLTSDDIFHI